ncbi:prepilin peptidase [Pandoraea cepalis]|uniref:prepilin peptidase n=1 Tax=Pandoraea cepalis TaxID=2508294 RepID=UPI00263AFCF0|nr:A24 family peptidase [Pandoraea cepalis]
MVGATLAWVLFLLALVDHETFMLPDFITIPLILAGILANSLGWQTTTYDAIGGALLGFATLWAVNTVRRIRKGEDGMGQGDFKLAAGIGAWFGMASVPQMFLIAAAVGLLVSVARGLRSDDLLPFGPFLSAAGLLFLLVGPDPHAWLTGVL